MPGSTTARRIAWGLLLAIFLMVAAQVPTVIRWLHSEVPGLFKSATPQTGVKVVTIHVTAIGVQHGYDL